jgi:hypothetical protein
LYSNYFSYDIDALPAQITLTATHHKLCVSVVKVLVDFNGKAPFTYGGDATTDLAAELITIP